MATELVCIGGSAGGTDALLPILEELSAAGRIPIVVVIHRRASGSGGLARLLQEHCARPVREIEDCDQIDPGIVYLAPGGYQTLIDDDGFLLTLEPPDHYSTPSINALFETAAECYGPDVVAVVLSSANADGVLGAQCVKSRGGIVVAQVPTTAEYPALIDAVMKATTTDAVLAPEQIGKMINDL